MYAETYDKRSEETRQEIRTMKACGMAAIFCAIFRTIAIVINTLLGSFAHYVSGSPIEEFYDFIFYNIIPICEIGVGILLIIVLIKGLGRIVQKEYVGKLLLILSVIFLALFIICIPIQMFFISDPVYWFPLGIFAPSTWLSPFSFTFLIWFFFIMLSFLGFSLTLGILLIKLDKKFLMGDLKLPAIFILLQTSFPISQILMLFNSYYGDILYAVAIVGIALTTFGYILLGVKLRKFY